MSHQMNQEQGRNALLSLLNLKRDKRYRRGAIQMARLMGVISQFEFMSLCALTDMGIRKFHDYASPNELCPLGNRVVS